MKNWNIWNVSLLVLENYSIRYSINDVRNIFIKTLYTDASNYL